MPMILFYMKMKQGINSLFINSKKGLVLILLEIIGLISIAYCLQTGYLNAASAGDILLLFFFILLGNSYLAAENHLNAKVNLADILSNVKSTYIIWAIYGQVYWSNLRVESLFPIIILLMGKLLWPWMSLVTILIFPLSATLLACLVNILISRYIPVLKAVFYLLFSFIWVGALILIFMTLLNKYRIPLNITDSHITVINLALFIMAIIILIFSKQISSIWKSSYLRTTMSSATIRKPFHIFKKFCLVFPQPLVVKDWFVLWRNPVTKIRMVVWLGLMLVFMLTSFKTYLHDPVLFILAVYVIWLICFGELPATAWQNEGHQKSLYWLSGLKPTEIIFAKVASYLPSIIFTGITVLILGHSVQLSWISILAYIGILLSMTIAAIIVAQAISGFNHGQAKNMTNNIILEQVPLTGSSIIALCSELVFCLFAFVSIYWMLGLCLIWASVAVITQKYWLNSKYYFGR